MELGKWCFYNRKDNIVYNFQTLVADNPNYLTYRAYVWYDFDKQDIKNIQLINLEIHLSLLPYLIPLEQTQ